METYAVIFNGVVENTIDYDAAPSTPPPGFGDGYTAILANGAGIGWSYANGAFTPPAMPLPTQAQLAQQAYASAIAAGLVVTSTSTPALNATYGVDTTAQANVTAIVTGIAAGLGLPGGESTFTYLDATSAPHTMTQAQFTSLGAAIRNYVYALDLYLAGQGALPSASATIP